MKKIYSLIIIILIFTVINSYASYFLYEKYQIISKTKQVNSIETQNSKIKFKIKELENTINGLKLQKAIETPKADPETDIKHIESVIEKQKLITLLYLIDNDIEQAIYQSQEYKDKLIEIKETKKNTINILDEFYKVTNELNLISNPKIKFITIKKQDSVLLEIEKLVKQNRIIESINKISSSSYSDSFANWIILAKENISKEEKIENLKKEIKLRIIEKIYD